MNQMQTLIPRHQFDSLVSRHSGDRYVKSFTCWNQLTILLYSQITGAFSLRDIVHAFRVHAPKMYHLGLEGVSKSTLADANAKRSAAIFEGLFYLLRDRFLSLSPVRSSFAFRNPLKVIDATTIDVCLDAFPWARFRTAKGAIKIHCQIEHADQIPSVITISDGKCHDIRAARNTVPLIPDSIYCVDRAYIDFRWFASIAAAGAFFVTRARSNFTYTVTGQHPAPLKNGVLSDEMIALVGYYQKTAYPHPLRRIVYHDPETGKHLVFITNNLRLAASSIAKIYKARWQIEVFFKWIKQNLRIKTFLGTSKNAVMTQIWVAMCYYLMLAYIKFQSKYARSLYYLHRIIRATVLERYTFIDLLRMSDAVLSRIKAPDPQLHLAL
jgi:hypothetical protein